MFNIIGLIVIGICGIVVFDELIVQCYGEIDYRYNVTGNDISLFTYVMYCLYYIGVVDLVDEEF